MKSLFSCLVLIVLALAASQPQGGCAPPTVHFQFREPRRTSYQVEDQRQKSQAGLRRAASGEAGVEWLSAWPQDGSTNDCELGRRVVLRVKSARDLGRLLRQRSLRVARTIT